MKAAPRVLEMQGFFMFFGGSDSVRLFKRCLVIGAALLILSFWFARVFYHLNQDVPSNAPLCFINGLTGFHCPFCGSTRAVRRVFSWSLAAAFKMNPMVVVLFPLSILAAAVSRKKPVGSIWLFMAALLFLFGVLRNIPVWPFDLLAPR